MSKDFDRTRRVGEQMQRELAPLIQQEVKDPRVGMVTVSGVEVSRDLSHAKVYVTRLGGGDIADSLLALKRASGFLRHELGRRMKIRIVPELRFLHDTSIEQGSRLSELIERAVEEDRKKSND